MKKLLAVCLLFTFLLSACGPSAQELALQTQQAQLAIQQQTIEALQTIQAIPTSTPKPTATQAPSLQSLMLSMDEINVLFPDYYSGTLKIDPIIKLDIPKRDELTLMYKPKSGTLGTFVTTIYRLKPDEAGALCTILLNSWGGQVYQVDNLIDYPAGTKFLQKGEDYLACFYKDDLVVIMYFAFFTGLDSESIYTAITMLSVLQAGRLP